MDFIGIRSKFYISYFYMGIAFNYEVNSRKIIFDFKKKKIASLKPGCFLILNFFIFCKYRKLYLFDKLWLFCIGAL